ncbi:MAG: hypothetical protein AB7V46_13430 [Thermomicrobiales bacterium]
MELRRALPLCLAVTALVAAYDLTDGSVRPLIGNGNLQPVSVLANETVEISIGEADGDEGRAERRALELTVHPNGDATIRRIRALSWRRNQPEPPPPVIERTDHPRLTSAAATRIRERLAQFRPESLNREFPFVLPLGCNFVMHGQGRISISYITPSREGGLFLIQRDCNHRNVERTIAALREIVAMFPQTSAASGFQW